VVLLEGLTVSAKGHGSVPGNLGCDLESWACAGGVIDVLRVSGEIDLHSVELVGAEFAKALIRSPSHLVVDLAAVSFCGLGGYALLVDTYRAATTAGINFALSGLTRHQDRVAALLWVADNPIRHRSAAAAVTAIRADRAARPA
jgi:anti-anti-sigma factor